MCGTEAHTLPIHYTPPPNPTPIVIPEQSGIHPAAWGGVGLSSSLMHVLPYLKHETTLRVHSCQQTQWHHLHRCHLQPYPAHLAAQKRLRRRLHQPTQRTSPCLVRDPPHHGIRHHPRATSQKVEPRLENQAHPPDQPFLARPLPRHNLTLSPFLYPSFPSSRESIPDAGGRRSPTYCLPPPPQKVGHLPLDSPRTHALISPPTRARHGTRCIAEITELP